MRSVHALVLRLVRDNPLWGYRRVHGELLTLGTAVAASTVWEMQRAAGIGHAPNRAATTWTQFLHSQAQALLPQAQHAPTHDTQRSGTISSDAVDLLGVLNASQALSSETNLDPLRDRVREVLSAMTGATAVHVLLRDDEAHRWQLADPAGEPGSTIPVEEDAARPGAPLGDSLRRTHTQAAARRGRDARRPLRP